MYDTAQPETLAQATTRWAPVCPVEQLEPLWGEAALIDGLQLAIILVPDGTLYAVSNQDPVTGAFVMSRGIVGSKAGRPTLASPLHKQVYDLATGDCVSAPELRIPTFAVRVTDGLVEVEVPLGHVTGM